MENQWVQDQLQVFMFDFDAADKDRSGSLSFSEVLDVLKAQGFNGSQEEAQAIFKEFDFDNNKSISRDEYFDGIRNLPKMKIADFYLRRTFNAMDKDGSGKVSGSEIQEEVFQGPYGLGITDETSIKMMLAQSQDDDGMLNYEEFLRVFNIESETGKVRQIFSKLDLDKSGFVQRDELYKAISQDCDLQFAVIHCRELFSAVKEDQDRKISFEEFEKMWREARKWQ